MAKLGEVKSDRLTATDTSENKAGYTATEVACGWAGVVINRSPKGNTWSAIPVALLCMVVNWNERQGSGPKVDEVL